MREYMIAAGGTSVSASAGCSLVAALPPNAPGINMEFLRYWAGQAANATSAQQRISIQTIGGSYPLMGGTGTGVVKQKFSDVAGSIIATATFAAAASGQIGVNAATSAGTTVVTAWEDCFNVLNGWLLVYTPPETRVMPAGSTSIQSLTFPAAPATQTGWSWGLVWREV